MIGTDVESVVPPKLSWWFYPAVRDL